MPTPLPFPNIPAHPNLAPQRPAQLPFVAPQVVTRSSGPSFQQQFNSSQIQLQAASNPQKQSPRSAQAQISTQDSLNPTRSPVRDRADRPLDSTFKSRKSEAESRDSNARTRELSERPREAIDRSRETRSESPGDRSALRETRRSNDIETRRAGRNRTDDAGAAEIEPKTGDAGRSEAIVETKPQDIDAELADQNHANTGEVAEAKENEKTDAAGADPSVDAAVGLVNGLATTQLTLNGSVAESEADDAVARAGLATVAGDADATADGLNVLAAARNGQAGSVKFEGAVSATRTGEPVGEVVKGATGAVGEAGGSLNADAEGEATAGGQGQAKSPGQAPLQALAGQGDANRTSASNAPSGAANASSNAIATLASPDAAGSNADASSNLTGTTLGANLPAGASNRTDAARFDSVPRTPEQQFAHDNVDQIVQGVRTKLLPGGGQMQIKLDPPELGALSIQIKVIDGRVTASFLTSGEEANRLLSQNLSQLKTSLEAGGVSVQRIDVRTSESSQSQSRSDDGRDGSRDGSRDSSRDGAGNQAFGGGASEQNRREMVEKMWRRLAYGSDELDVIG
jgi:flagellar hook-length control protein FliK